MALITWVLYQLALQPGRQFAVAAVLNVVATLKEKAKDARALAADTAAMLILPAGASHLPQLCQVCWSSATFDVTVRNHVTDPHTIVLVITEIVSRREAEDNVDGVDGW